MPALNSSPASKPSKSQDWSRYCITLCCWQMSNEYTTKSHIVTILSNFGSKTCCYGDNTVLLCYHDVMCQLKVKSLDTWMHTIHNYKVHDGQMKLDQFTEIYKTRQNWSQWWRLNPMQQLSQFRLLRHLFIKENIIQINVLLHWQLQWKSTTVEHATSAGSINQSMCLIIDIISNTNLWRSGAEPDMTKLVDLAWAYSKMVRWQHWRASTSVDATRPQKKRTTKEWHLEERSGEGDVQGRHLGGS